ncbi:hypothetical protein GCM10020001_016100 [Nonomuraea salmonea]
MKTILSFAEIDAGMLAEVGGKAANLGELTGAGLPVPPGWVLTTEAYRRVAEGLDTGGPAPAERARRHLLEAPMPEDMRAAIVGGVPGARGRRAGGGALLRHRRGPAVRQLRRPAGHLPQRGGGRRRS